jgi:hypothetical protein
MSDEKPTIEKIDKPRKPYVPPAVMAINLRPEEAVLGHCKIGSSAGPISVTGCSTLHCRTIGS